jgi:superfamily II DNA or RNA helicase
MGYELRPYQKECIEAIDSMENNKPGLVVLSTGSGKTVVMADVAAKNTGRTLIVLPSTELRQQTIDKLLETDNTLDIGSVQGSLDQVNNMIVCCTRQSLTHSKSTRIQRMLEFSGFSLIIFDECHQAVSQIAKILSKIDTSESKVLGFTATPFSKDITDVFKDVVYSKDILYMIDSKFLVEPRVLQISTKTNLSGVKSVAGDFQQRALEQACNTDYRNDLIVKTYKNYCDNRKTLIFATGIEHSEDLTREFNSQGIKCKSIDSSLSREQRDTILQEFRDGVFNVLTNVNVMTTGVDIPSISCVMLARPTRSKILYMQAIGRGFRLYEGKTDCLIVDFQDASTSHDIMDMSNIFDVNFKGNQTLSEAREDKKTEDIAKKAEREKIEQERIENLEIIAKQIKLFNKEMRLAFAEDTVSYDWFKVSPSVYAVSESSDNHIAIESGDNEFLIYKVITTKGNKSVEFIDAFQNVTDAILFAEQSIKAPKSFAYKGILWKNQPASDAQKKYVSWAKCKWDCHKYFSSNSIKSALRNF